MVVVVVVAVVNVRMHRRAQLSVSMRVGLGLGLGLVFWQLLSELLYEARIFPWALLRDLCTADFEAVYDATRRAIRGSYRQQLEERFAGTVSSGGDGPLEVLVKAASLEREEDFAWKVYRQHTCPLGLAVEQAIGPHGRTVHWVEQVQTRGKPSAAAAGGSVAGGGGGDREGTEWSASATVKVLKEACRARGLKVSGRKSELIERLEKYDAGNHVLTP